MEYSRQNHGDDVETWSHVAESLYKLKSCIDHSNEFLKRFSKHMSKDDRVEMASMSVKLDGIYWKYWGKLINKIRGL